MLINGESADRADVANAREMRTYVLRLDRSSKYEFRIAVRKKTVSTAKSAKMNHGTRVIYALNMNLKHSIDLRRLVGGVSSGL